MPDSIRTKAEHLAWAKTRALEYVESGDLPNAFTSMTSDLNKHEDLRNHPATELGMLLMLSGHLATAKAMREWVEGYN